MLPNPILMQLCQRKLSLVGFELGSDTGVAVTINESLRLWHTHCLASFLTSCLTDRSICPSSMVIDCGSPGFPINVFNPSLPALKTLDHLVRYTSSLPFHRRSLKLQDQSGYVIDYVGFTAAGWKLGLLLLQHQSPLSPSLPRTALRECEHMTPF